MHLAPGSGRYDLIVLVDYWEGLFWPIASVSRGNRRDAIGQCDPLPEREFFRAGLWIETELNGCLLPVGDVLANEFAELLASL